MYLWLLSFWLNSMLRARRQKEPDRLILDEQGLFSRCMGQERSICWDEVRLFACYRIDTQYYELVNEQTVVRWRVPLEGIQETKPSVAMSQAELFRQVNRVVLAHTGRLLLEHTIVDERSVK